MKKLLIAAAITIVGIFVLLLTIASHSTRQSPQAAPAVSTQPTPTPQPPSLNVIHYQLEADYLRMINEVNHNYYNYVTAAIKKSKGGYTLYASHSFFNRYQFEIGSFGKEVSAWIDKNHATLKLGKITRVGVHGTGPYASYTYYEIR